MNLEEKLIKSNDEIDTLLNEDVEVKIICIINNKILLHNESMLLPKFRIKKGILSDEEIINNANELLNITINKIDSIQFDKYNNYNERYFSIIVNEKDLLDINNLYSFNSINNMNNINEKEIISRL